MGWIERKLSTSFQIYYTYTRHSQCENGSYPSFLPTLSGAKVELEKSVGCVCKFVEREYNISPPKQRRKELSPFTSV